MSGHVINASYLKHPAKQILFLMIFCALKVSELAYRGPSYGYRRTGPKSLREARLPLLSFLSIAKPLKSPEIAINEAKSKPKWNFLCKRGKRKGRRQ